MEEPSRTYVEQRQALCRVLKEMLVERLDLPIDPDWITDDQPLFGRGLELDSVDALELVSGIEYVLEVGVDDQDVSVFGSVNTMADFIQRNGGAELLADYVGGA